ncbi:MAG: beta-galactosidase [Phycisphaerae bacterium]|jgi:beta-galactosidase
MYVGVDFYPEHWPREFWDKSAALMAKANFNVVRLAEFAWVMMEPEEGRFEFDWLDEAIAVLAKRGISVILGTPTAVMPAWVVRKYPECMATKIDGQKIEWGVRKNNCFSAGTYRLLSQRITRAMAEHYHAHPAVIGWQTDNEFGTPMCYCDSCRAGFHDWLRARYRTLEELNRAWGTHFWGLRFGEWSEIPLPIDTGGCNPGLYLDWRRYYSWQNVTFQREQVQILRQLCPRHFITHNFMGLWSAMVDYYDLAEDLDFVSWDNYPVGPGLKADSALAADLMRGLKKKNIWIMEQTGGPPGWRFFHANPRPGQIRQVAYHHMAHGADGQLWFRWRTCTAGREQYWHGLLGHDGKPGRRYKEAAQFAGELKKLAKHVEGTTVKSQVAILYDYDSLWVIEDQSGYEQNNYKNVVQRYSSALLRAGVNMDVISPQSDFAGFRVVVAPDLNVLPDALAKRLSAFVAEGGVLLTDCRTGVKDETSLCHPRTLPGLLSETLGVVIDEYEGLDSKTQYPVVGQGDLAGNFTAVHYADWLSPRGAEVLGAYQPWHMKKFAAVTRNKYRKGTAFYVGTVFNEEGFYDALMACVLKAGRVRPILTPPEGVEVSVRQGKGKKVLFVLNHTEDEKSVKVPVGKLELLSGKKTGATLTLGRYGVAVIKL